MQTLKSGQRGETRRERKREEGTRKTRAKTPEWRSTQSKQTRRHAAAGRGRGGGGAQRRAGDEARARAHGCDCRKCKTAILAPNCHGQRFFFRGQRDGACDGALHGGGADAPLPCAVQARKTLAKRSSNLDSWPLRVLA
ncbi:hypothetical protein FGB62_7g525 [Gracilaria domingensis]|nr:hypothetical protein FGB62_7g525 [Gracilaria domingensis]